MAEAKLSMPIPSLLISCRQYNDPFKDLRLADFSMHLALLPIQPPTLEIMLMNMIIYITQRKEIQKNLHPKNAQLSYVSMHSSRYISTEMADYIISILNGGSAVPHYVALGAHHTLRKQTIYARKPEGDRMFLKESNVS